MTPMIKYRGAEVPIEITYKRAMFDLKNLGVNVLSLFEQNDTLPRILADDETLIKLWYYFLEEGGHVNSLENAIESLTPDGMQEFRDAFWTALVNFTNPQMRPALTELRRVITKQLSSPQKNFERLLSELSEEQESIPTTTPSENSS